ncbi:homoserine O-acetyltransferase [Testicularia cyperi]|uniref:Homoserine O-acetyltransferase n=1 Tax=Testicularia cyperi TaxID=1882483 RepID=A0A317XIM9_9BASI|nr:homoserine O-acetyltransferase [Testicularia cyperi]
MAEYDHRLPRPREIPGPTSPQSCLLGARQRYLLFPEFKLESGVALTNVTVAFKTWGQLAPDTNDNALVVAHALTGSADVEDWWGPLLGIDKLFDPSRYFIVCCNVLGSPYGSASSCTQAGGESDWFAALSSDASDSSDHLEAVAHAKRQWRGDGWWGPEFPATTVRDDVRIQKLVLEYLGVESIAAVIGGSMGGMAVLEWPLVFPTRWPGQQDAHVPPKRYIQSIVPIATSARHSAWCISWAEAQRQSIYSDPQFKHGYYDPAQPPRNGLSAARMAALLTYRSRDSFEARFGRRVGKALKGGGAASGTPSAPITSSATTNGSTTPLSALPDEAQEKQAKLLDEQRRRSIAADAAAAHNEGNLSPRVRPYGSNSSPTHENGYFLPAATNGPSLKPTATTPPVPASVHPPTELSDEAAKLPPAAAAAPSAAPASRLIEPFSPSTAPQIFSAQSYLRYQGDKFVNRFDANCYIHLTRKMDSHDVARERWGWNLEVESVTRETGDKPVTMEQEDEALMSVLDFLSAHAPSLLKPQPPVVQVVSIESDGLFAPPEQILMHNLIQGSSFVSVKSTDGHDGFLLEFEQINQHVGQFLREKLGFIYERTPLDPALLVSEGAPIKESVFGEVEDVTRW